MSDNEREERAAQLLKAARIGRKYTSATGNRFVDVEWPDGLVTVRVRGGRAGKYGQSYQPDHWGDALGTEETRAGVIKAKAVELRMEAGW